MIEARIEDNVVEVVWGAVPQICYPVYRHHSSRERIAHYDIACLSLWRVMMQ